MAGKWVKISELSGNTFGEKLHNLLGFNYRVISDDNQIIYLGEDSDAGFSTQESANIYSYHRGTYANRVTGQYIYYFEPKNGLICFGLSDTVEKACIMFAADTCTALDGTKGHIYVQNPLISWTDLEADSNIVTASSVAHIVKKDSYAAMIRYPHNSNSTWVAMADHIYYSTCLRSATDSFEFKIGDNSFVSMVTSSAGNARAVCQIS